MFSRKKKDERREKKRHKPGMTQAEITKLEEVGIRRGFFSKMTNSGKRDKEESIQKRNISRPLSLQLSENDHSNEKDLPSVLQRANLFGQVVHSQRRTSVTSPPVSPPASGDAPPSMVRQTTEGSIKHPVPPVRRKVSTKSLKQTPSVPYDVPKPPVKALDDSYSTPHSWKQPTREAHVVSAQKQRASGPQIRQVKPRPHRTVILRKRTAGDFGVSLRRSAMIEHVNGKEEKRTVYFAEPGNAMLADMDFHDDISSRLYTGDRLIEIDGFNVENASRDEIVSRIKSAGNQVTLVVQSLHDSDEVDLDSPDSLYNISRKPEALPRLNARNNSFQAKDDDAPKLPATKKAEGITKEEPKQNGVPDVVHISTQPGLTWTRKEKVWFRHSDGISSAHVVEPEGDASAEKVIEGKTRIELEPTKEVVMVPEDDVELANEAQFDRAGDVTTLRHLNESSVLHTLSQRYEGSLLYSFAGPHLISVRPPYSHAAAANNYTTKIKQTYKGSRFGDTPPHIYGIAQHAYQDMMSSLNDQCIVNLGYTGSGKTNNTRHILNYFATIGFHTNSRLTVERVLSVVDVFESLSSAATVQCKNASRCIHVYNLDFDRTGQLAALSVQAMLLEKSRLVKRPEGEANFNIFYQLLHGADTQLRRELFLLDVEQESNPLIISSFNSDPTFHQMSVKGFGSLRDSFTSLEFTPDEIKAVFYVLAACLHLGMAGAQRVSGGRFQFARADSAQKAASLLGVPAEKLSKIIFQVPASFGKRSRSSSTASLKRSGSMNLSPSNHSAPAEEAIETGQHQLDTFIIGLYSQVFRTIVSLINRSLSSSQRAQNTVSVVDTPGYQGWDTEHTNNPATYADLTFNYVQDRLHSLFHYNAFTLHKERYQQEDIDCDVLVPEDNFTSSIDLIDQPPSLGNIGAKGLLWILDEEASSPGATDESFIERLLLHYSKTNQNNGHTVVQRSQNQGRFLLHHQAGVCRVEYDAAGWLNYARYNSTQTDASDALQDSKKKFISDVFGSGAEKIQGSIASLKLDGGSSSLKRVSSIRKGWSSASGAVAIKKSTCMLTKFQTDGLVDTLRRTQPHFILSFVPQPSGHEALSLDVITVRKQLCGFQLLEAARTLKQGYPEHVVFSDFRRRFDVLLRHLSSKLPSNSTSVSLMEDKEATENILKEVELNRSQFRIGASQVFFRSGVLNMLEDRRNEKVSDVMVAFQACCRGYLARKRFERKKVQVVAVRCIQRNIRKFMAIRQWPWWRLLTKVLPLVEVTRTEEELREKQAEFDLLKEKFERIQTERDDLKLSNSKYETKLQDVMLHLEDQHSTASHATDMLEHERKERLRLEKLLKDAQASSIELQGRVEMVEVELAEKKLLYSEHVVSIMDSDEEIEDGQYKVKYEQAVREFNFQAKKKSQEHEDALEEAQSEKKTLERKMIQLQEELEDQRRLEQQARKKLHRINAELSDAKIHLDETASKNHELEKKQRKFDSELYAAQADATDLKTSRDRVQREKDKIVLEKKDLERELDDKSDEVDSLKMKVRRLEEELEDNSTRDTDDRQMVNQLKKQIRELDAKMKDQEEELDEQANTIHTLEQARERLEMAAEQARQQRQREVEGKEDELEEMRTSYHKKIKQLELQLEEVEEERSSIQKQKRELEQEVKDSRDQEAHGHDVEMERRLRRDLKRYKALLADAQTMIDHLKADVVNKQQMKQLKAQVEDLQYTSSSAVKSRKAIELEVEDLQTQLEEVSRAKQESESRVSSLQREVHELNSKLEEDGEDTQETHRKYRNLVNQQTDDRRQLVELQASVEDLKHEKNNLEEKIAGLQNQIEYLEESTTDNATAARLESKAKDLETKLDFQKTTTRRLEVQLARAKENLDKCMSERDSHIAGELREKEAFKRVQRQLRESKDEQAELLKREQEALQKKHDLDMEVNEHQNQIDSLQADLKLAFKRISDLQIALEELEESDIDDDDDSMSSSDEDDVLTQSRYGWRSRLSTTSGYSDRGRTRSSIASSRISEEDRLSDSGTSKACSYPTSKSATGLSLKGGSPTSANTKVSSLKKASPVEESMSGYGQRIASSLASKKRRGSISCTSSVSGTPMDDNGSTKEAKYPAKLDRMSKTLADEDPSMLLYGKPSNISMNLGLGKAKSFQALNESLRAVKHRQNLPKSQRVQLQLRDKVNNDIHKMQSRRHEIERCSSAMDLRDDDESYLGYDDTLSLKDYNQYSYSDVEEEAVRHPRVRSKFPAHNDRVVIENRRRTFPQQHGQRSRSSSISFDDFSEVSSERKQPSSFAERKRVYPLSTYDDLLSKKDPKSRAAAIQQLIKAKPFKSRFLNQIQKENIAFGIRKEMPQYAEADDDLEDYSKPVWQKKGSPKQHYNASDGDDDFSSVSDHFADSGRNSRLSRSKKEHSRTCSLDYLDDVTSHDTYLDDEDDISLSRYGVTQSPSSSFSGESNFTSVSQLKRPIRQSRPAKREAVPTSVRKESRFLSRSRSRNRDSPLLRSSSCDLMSDDNSYDVGQSSPDDADISLDSIISKYLYRK
ncbi:unnamed protein product [Clavelina lepadiformis]|uniref:Unconventional myosin-XVIIIa n=1 Tax=Clavelina lepadiformis TaxID=159417 RepID=A0ABP0GMW0_CLALP